MGTPGGKFGGAFVDVVVEALCNVEIFVVLLLVTVVLGTEEEGVVLEVRTVLLASNLALLTFTSNCEEVDCRESKLPSLTAILEKPSTNLFPVNELLRVVATSDVFLYDFALNPD